MAFNLFIGFPCYIVEFLSLISLTSLLDFHFGSFYSLNIICLWLAYYLLVACIYSKLYERVFLHHFYTWSVC